MGRERGGRATRSARRGTHNNGSGGSPAFWDSRTRPGTRPRPDDRRRPLQPHEHSSKDHGASRRGAWSLSKDKGGRI